MTSLPGLLNVLTDPVLQSHLQPQLIPGFAAEFEGFLGGGAISGPTSTLPVERLADGSIKLSLQGIDALLPPDSVIEFQASGFKVFHPDGAPIKLSGANGSELVVTDGSALVARGPDQSSTVTVGANVATFDRSGAVDVNGLGAAAGTRIVAGAGALTIKDANGIVVASADATGAVHLAQGDVVIARLNDGTLTVTDGQGSAESLLTIAEGGGRLRLTEGGGLRADIPDGRVDVDPVTRQVTVEVAGTKFVAAAVNGYEPSVGINAQGRPRLDAGGGGTANFDEAGNVLWAFGNTVVTLPPGAQVTPNASGGFTVATPAGTEGLISGVGGTVVALPLGGTFVLAPATDGGVLADLGNGRLIAVDTDGALSVGVNGVLAPVAFGNGGIASAADLFALQDMDFDPIAAATANNVGAGAVAPSLPGSTVDIGVYNDWLEDQGAEGAAWAGTRLNVVSSPTLQSPSTASQEEAFEFLYQVSTSGRAAELTASQQTAATWQAMAEALGMQDEAGGQTAGARLAGYVSTGQAALGVISSLKSVIERPTIRNVAGAAHQLVSMGVQFDAGMQTSIGFALGATKPFEDAAGNVYQVLDTDALQGLLAGAGTALSIIAAIENPTPANVVGAGMHVFNALDLGYQIPAVGAIASAIGFVENPSVEGGLNTVVWTIAAVNPAFIPFAAVYSVISTVASIFGGGKPIVLDMDGDGIVELTPVDASTAFYDLDGDGWREHRGWAGGGDGLLALDANGDGFITGRDELSFLGYKEGARTDLEGLVAFDSNNDGKLSALDEHWGRFKVWIDADADGFSDAGELRTLVEAGIAEIILDSDRVQSASGGNEVFGHGKFKLADGTERKFADAKLGTDSQIARSVPGAAPPLVFNLIGNAVHTIAASAVNVSFDMDSNGTRERRELVALARERDARVPAAGRAYQGRARRLGEDSAARPGPRRGRRYERPPSTDKICPVIQAACSLARNTTAVAMSCAEPRRRVWMPCTSRAWPSAP